MRLALVLLALVPLSLFAQQRYDDTVTVDVVEVPVYVERFGNPVTGLTRDDFELIVDGQPRAIDHFDVIDAGRASLPESAERAEARSTLDLERRRLVVLLFDVGGSSVYALQYARRKAVHYLARSGAGDTYAVATIGRQGVRMLVPFTTDLVAVQRAIGTLAPSEAADPFRVATLDAERSFWREVSSGTEGGLRPFIDLWGGPRGAIAWELQEYSLRQRHFVDSLTGLANRLAPLSGVKHVVLLSERSGIGEGTGMFQPAMRLHERFRAAGVVLDGVDIRAAQGPGGSASVPAPPEDMPDLAPSTFLYNLASGTGGAVTSSLEHLQKRNRVTYVVGFRAQKQSGTVRVRVKNRPLLTDVRHRTSYTVDAGASGGDDSLFLADTILNDIPQRGVTLDVDVNGTWVAATIPGAELLAHDADEPLPLDVYFYVFNDRNEAVGWNRLRILVDLVAGRDFLASRPYTIRQEFHLGPGRYAAKALVRVSGTELTGFAREDFVVR